MNLSIVLPSYKSAHTLRSQLPAFLEWLRQTYPESEVIVVDDGSGDNGATEMAAKENGCVFIGLPQNRGKGGAVRAGMQVAKGQCRLFTDADIPFEFEAVERFVHYIREMEFDIVIGDRRLPESRYFRQIEGARRVGSNLFTFLVRRLVTTRLIDTQCGIKAFSGKVADDLFSVARLNSFAFDVEILYIALNRNYAIKRLPVSLRGRQYRSSISLVRHTPRMLLDLFRIKRNHLRGCYASRNTN
jgi:dolichyl-phosphate beta-glucosyltransferase